MNGTYSLLNEHQNIEQQSWQPWPTIDLHHG